MSKDSLLDKKDKYIPVVLNILRLATLIFFVPVYAFFVLRITMSSIAMYMVMPCFKILSVLFHRRISCYCYCTVRRQRGQNT